MQVDRLSERVGHDPAILNCIIMYTQEFFWTMNPLPTLIGLGEVLWDLLPAGPQVGGSPANVVFHAGHLGLKGVLVSRCGADDAGRQLRHQLAGKGVSLEHLQVDPHHATGVAEVSLRSGEAHFEIRANAAWDYLEATDDVLTLAGGADGLCFGSLGQRHAVARASIRRIVESTRPACVRCFDVNLRAPFYDRDSLLFGLEHATLLKCTSEEMQTLAQLFDVDGATALLRAFPLTTVVETSGAAGCRVTTRRECLSIPAPKVEVVDPVGAGDAFCAAFVAALLQGRSIGVAARAACRLGALVVSQTGAMPARGLIRQGV